MIARRCQFVLLSRVEISKKVIRIVTICRHMSNTTNWMLFESQKRENIRFCYDNCVELLATCFTRFKCHSILLLEKQFFKWLTIFHWFYPFLITVVRFLIVFRQWARQISWCCILYLLRKSFAVKRAHANFNTCTPLPTS